MQAAHWPESLVILLINQRARNWANEVQALNNAGSSLARLLLIAAKRTAARGVSQWNAGIKQCRSFIGHTLLFQVLLINKSVPHRGVSQWNARNKLCRLLIGQTPFLRCSCLRMDSVPLGFLLIDGNFREGLIGFAGGKDAFTSFTKANKTVPTGWGTVCPTSLAPFCIVSYHIKWVKTSWTCSSGVLDLFY